MRGLVAIIDTGAIRRNAIALKTYTKRKLCAVVKADAYGHGAEHVVCALDGVADSFAVATCLEGVAVKIAACGREILVLTPPTSLEETEELAAEGLSVTVADLVTARYAASVASKTGAVRVHLKTNTGMNRYGMNDKLLGRVCKYLAAEKNVKVEGLYSHLYDLSEAETSRAIFERHRRIFLRYFPRGICHLSATGGTAKGEAFFYDTVRIGLGLYGYVPDGVVAPVALEKAMRVYAEVAASRKYSFGGCGYGKTDTVERAKKSGVSVLSFGYADGYPTAGTVLREQANGLCMNACLVLGRKKRGTYAEILTDADESAKRSGTISYETLCKAAWRAERIYV